MASVGINVKNTDATARKVSDMLDRYWQLIPTGKLNGLKRRMAAAAKDLAFTPEQQATVAAAMDDELIGKCLTTTDDYEVRLVLDADQRIFTVCGDNMPVENSYDNIVVYMKYDHPMFLEVLEAAHYQRAFARLTYKVEDFTKKFIEARNTWGAVRRDWPELTTHLPPEYRGKLGNTVARGEKELTADEEEWIPIANDVLSKCALLENCNKFNYIL